MKGGNFLSCDWGTSRFRLRLVNASTLAVLGEKVTNEGVASLYYSQTSEARAGRYAEVLAGRIRELFDEAGCAANLCVVSGMASSRIGWFELPYVETPFPLTATELQRRTLSLHVTNTPVKIHLVSGVRTTDDVMRGEECELLGLAQLIPEMGCSGVVLVLPGTHSKHVEIENGVVNTFTTHMTGELYAQLRALPTLREALAGADQFSEPDFCEGVLASRRLGLTASLFKIRSRSLNSNDGTTNGSSFLSGALIGAEIERLPQSDRILLGGSSQLRAPYLLASKLLGRNLTEIPEETLNRALLHAHRCLANIEM
jgi:2-dehydro-3-deoxygalactonokinase